MLHINCTLTQISTLQNADALPQASKQMEFCILSEWMFMLWRLNVSKDMDVWPHGGKHTDGPQFLVGKSFWKVRLWSTKPRLDIYTEQIFVHCFNCIKYYNLIRSGIESWWGRDFPPVQTGLGAHPASCKMGTESFPGVKCGRGVLMTTRPILVPRPWKSKLIPLPHHLSHTGSVTGSLYLLLYPDGGYILRILHQRFLLLDILTIPADDKHGSIVIIEIKYAESGPWIQHIDTVGLVNWVRIVPYTPLDACILCLLELKLLMPISTRSWWSG